MNKNQLMVKWLGTHRWSVAFCLIVKPISTALFMGLGIGLFVLLEVDILYAILLGIFTDSAIHIYFINPLLAKLSTYLYIRRDLETKISFKEAKAFVHIFEACSDKWYPLKQIKELPEEDRLAALYKICIKITEEWDSC